MKTEKELREEVRRVRERVRELSGFWVGEASAAIYALEWALGKRDPSPSVDLGLPNGGREKIASGLVKLAPKIAARPAAEKKAAVKPSSRLSKAKR
jgi:hypothetical protein